MAYWFDADALGTVPVVVEGVRPRAVEPHARALSAVPDVRRVTAAPTADGPAGSGVTRRSPPAGGSAWVRRPRHRIGYQPTATRSHCGLAWEMKEDWPATSS